MKAFRAALGAGGVLLMVYAAVGMLSDTNVKPGGVLVFLAAVLIAHDAVWMPAAVVFGILVTRVVARRHRSAVQAAALSGAAIGIVALPLVLRVGRAADNPSIQPLHYGRNLGLVLLALAAGTALTTRLRRRRSRAETGQPADTGKAWPGR